MPNNKSMLQHIINFIHVKLNLEGAGTSNPRNLSNWKTRIYS